MSSPLQALSPLPPPDHKLLTDLIFVLPYPLMSVDAVPQSHGTSSAKHAMLSPRGYWVTSGDHSCLSHLVGGWYWWVNAGIWWVEARNTAKYPTMHRIVPYDNETKNAPNVRSAEVEKLWQKCVLPRIPFHLPFSLSSFLPNLVKCSLFFFQALLKFSLLWKAPSTLILHLLFLYFLHPIL